MDSVLKQITPGRAAIIASLVSLVLYLITLNPTYGFVDKGELMAVASTLGIAHPTGYPTVMLLGHLFTLILPVRDVLALNIMAALLTAASVGVITLLFTDILRRLAAPRAVRRDPKGKGRDARTRDAKKRGKGEPAQAQAEATAAAVAAPVERDPSDGARALMAACGALLVGLTGTWWNQGNGFEVYSLHALFIPLLSLLFIRCVDRYAGYDPAHPGEDWARWHRGDPEPSWTREGLLFSLMLGLSFTNHMTTILLAPAFLVYYFWRLKGHGVMPLLYLIPGFIIGLLPYAWLPIRAAMEPYFNWGNPETLERFIWHVTGKQYQVWMFSSAEVYSQQTSYFFSKLPGELAFVGIVLALLGLFHLGKRSPKILVWSLLLFIACVIYAGGFDIMEIGPYYMTAIFAVGVWLLAGIDWLRERFGMKAALGAATAAVVLFGAMNFRESDESGNTLVEDMTVNMLQTLPQNAVILSSQWDFWLAGSWYMQRVEGMRPDVTVIDHELIRRSWYLDHLEQYHGELMKKLKPQLEFFRAELDKFEHDLSYDYNAIQSGYVGLINAIIDSNIASRPVLLTGEIVPEIGARYTRTPYHLALRLMPDTSYLPQEFPKYRFNLWKGRLDSYAARTYELYARSALARALYEQQHGRRDETARYFQLALSFDPKLDPNDIPDMALNSEEQIQGTITFFDQLWAQARTGGYVK